MKERDLPVLYQGLKCLAGWFGLAQEYLFVSPEVWVSQEESDLKILKVELKFDPPYLGSVRLYKH